MRKLTTTSYAMLGLLAIKPWSTYELARQMDRSLGYVWPRARSVVYEEPKGLVEHGLARARIEEFGRRTRTIYAITPKGRRALRAWLGKSSAPPLFESEALVRTIFAEHGSRDDLIQALESVRTSANEIHRSAVAIGHSLLEDNGPFPDRLHVNALGGRFVLEYASALDRWARWALDEVRQWPDTTSVAERGRRLLTETIATLGAPDT
jgi:DNA-binding PadR family transcriptional regulator